MKSVSVVSRPHLIVAIPPHYCFALLAASLGLTLLACGGGSPVAPAPVAGLPDTSTAGTPTKTTFVVSGIVRGGDHPLVDATIELEGSERHSTRTGADGAYRFSEVESGEYMLRASGAGYTTAEQRITIAADVSRDLSLTPASVIPPPPPPAAPSPDPARHRLYGRIHDHIDTSLPGAKVELVSGPDAGAVTFSQNPALYEFRNLRAGTYLVRASREGYRTREVQQELRADTELIIRLELFSVPAQSGVFEGLVWDDSSGQKLEGVKVEAITGLGAGRVMTTSGGGVFWFELPPGATRFRWSKDGYVSREEEVSVLAGVTIILNVALRKIPPPPPPLPQPPFTVIGKVTDSRGNPVGRADVRVYGNDSPVDHLYGTGSTDGSGRFNIPSLQRRPSGAGARKDGYISKDVKVPSSSSSTLTVDITIPRIERYVLLAPLSLKVGQRARIEAQMDLDDGSRSTGSIFMAGDGGPSSSNPSVVEHVHDGWVRGVAPGTATITTTYYGAKATLKVRVDP